MRETFNIKVTMERRWIPIFLSFLKRMHSLGNVGASRKLSFYSDGDGDFHPKFEWDTKIEPAIPPEVDYNPRYDEMFDAG